jgi:hypothetical protein
MSEDHRKFSLFTPNLQSFGLLPQPDESTGGSGSISESNFQTSKFNTCPPPHAEYLRQNAVTKNALRTLDMELSLMPHSKKMTEVNSVEGLFEVLLWRVAG